jgi:hypothetical protein
MQKKMRKQLSHNPLFLVLMMGLFLMGPLSIAEDNPVKLEAIKDHEQRNEKLKEHLDNVLSEDPTLESSQKPAAKEVKIVAVQKEEEVPPPPPITDLSSFKNLKPEQFKKLLAPIQRMSEEEITALVKESSKQGPYAHYLEENPRLTLFIVKMFRDKHAILDLFKITQDKDKLKEYIFVLVGTLFFGLIFAKILKNTEGGFLAALILFIFRYSVMTVLRLWITYFYFSKELDATIKIFTKTFL